MGVETPPDPLKSGAMDKKTDKQIKNVANLLAQDVEGKPVDWERVARAVDYWLQKYPQEAMQFAEDIRDLREALKDPEFGSAEHARIRQLIFMPPRLGKLIAALEPEYSNKKNIGTFVKRFPMFMLPDKR